MWYSDDRGSATTCQGAAPHELPSKPLFTGGARNTMPTHHLFTGFSGRVPMIRTLVSLVLASVLSTPAVAFAQQSASSGLAGSGNRLVSSCDTRRHRHHYERRHQRPADDGYRRRGTVLRSRASARHLSHQGRAPGLPDRRAAKLRPASRRDGAPGDHARGRGRHRSHHRDRRGAAAPDAKRIGRTGHQSRSKSKICR